MLCLAMDLRLAQPVASGEGRSRYNGSSHPGAPAGGSSGQPSAVPCLQVDWSGCPAVRLRVPIPQGPDRAYFQRMLAEQWAEYEDEEDYDDDGDGEYDDDEDEEEEGEADGHADGGDGEAQASEGGAAAAPGAVG